MLPITARPEAMLMPTKAPVVLVPPTTPLRLIAVIVLPWMLEAVVVPAEEK